MFCAPRSKSVSAFLVLRLCKKAVRLGPFEFGYFHSGEMQKFGLFFMGRCRARAIMCTSGKLSAVMVFKLHVIVYTRRGLQFKWGFPALLLVQPRANTLLIAYLLLLLSRKIILAIRRSESFFQSLCFLKNFGYYCAVVEKSWTPHALVVYCLALWISPKSSYFSAVTNIYPHAACALFCWTPRV